MYIAGPMTGVKNFNYDAFNAAAKDLRAQSFDVINPAEGFDGEQDLARTVYMRAAIENLLTCNTIVLLPDWQRSPGAIFEVGIASALGMSILRYAPGKPPEALL